MTSSPRLTIQVAQRELQPAALAELGPRPTFGLLMEEPRLAAIIDDAIRLQGKHHPPP